MTFPLLLFLLSAAGVVTTSSPTPTFVQDVAPLLYRHCAGCHHSGTSAPFPLISYADAKMRASLIAEVTRTRMMPPWKPLTSKTSPHFEGSRSLTSAEIGILSRWASTGAHQGDISKLPSPPQFPESEWAGERAPGERAAGERETGQPDQIIRLSTPFQVPAEGPDLYQCFVIPTHVTGTHYIRAVEFRPGNPRVVHHALLFTELSHIKTEPSYPCFGSIGLLPTNGLGGWSPGNGPIRMPEGAAIPIEQGSRLIAQVHFHPVGKPETVQWQVGLYYADKAPTRRVVDVGLSSKQIDIPAGDSHYVVRDHFVLPVAVWAIGIIPHAHYVCREMHGRATLPNGRVIHLLDIEDWDFNWQDQYRYQKPILLPEDTRIDMEFVYDNSAANPRNPNSPPQRVTWGAGVTDEMAGLHVQAIPVDMNDLPELGRALWGKVMRSVGGSFYRLPQ